MHGKKVLGQLCQGCMPCIADDYASGLTDVGHAAMRLEHYQKLGALLLCALLAASLLPQCIDVRCAL